MLLTLAGTYSLVLKGLNLSHRASLTIPHIAVLVSPTRAPAADRSGNQGNIILSQAVRHVSRHVLTVSIVTVAVLPLCLYDGEPFDVD
jgi:hypothetical protein